MKLKRLVVIGAGAIGGSVGALLGEAGYPVALVARGQHAQQMQNVGLVVRMPDRSLNVRPDVFDGLERVDWQAGDIAMLATKLHDLRSPMDDLVAHAGKQLPVICATNGIHGERWAAERFETVLSMLVWMPATHLKPGDVAIHSGPCRGVLDNGPVCGDEAQTLSEQLCEWLTAASFDAVHRPDIQRWKYAKWITNLGSAAQAMVVDDWKAVAERARQEGETVLEAAGVARVATQELLDRCQRVKLDLVDGAKREGGSTWQSYQTGRPMETRWIEGAMADLADQSGVPAPVNRFLSDVAARPRALRAAEVWQATGLPTD